MSLPFYAQRGRNSSYGYKAATSKKTSVPTFPAPKAGVNAGWDRYALDPEETDWVAGKTLLDKGAKLSKQTIDATTTWWYKNQRPPANPSQYTPWGTTGTGTGSGSGSGGSGSSYGGGYGYSGGVGGGGASAPAPITWASFGSNVANAPSWWKAMKPSEMNPETEFMASLNMLIPFLSPEDQKTAASTIYQINAKDFSHLNPETIKVTPENELSSSTTRYFTSADRANRALSALTELAGAVGKSDADLGPGYRYLRSILDAGKQFGGGGEPNSGQTRRQYQQMMGALDPLLAQSGGTGSVLSPYGSLVKMLAQPYFSGGQLMPMTKTSDGRYVFGTPNAQLF